MVVLDATIVNIALPSAQAALDFSDRQRWWIVTAYALAFGSLLLARQRQAAARSRYKPRARMSFTQRYELELVGRPPFDGEAAVALALKHIQERPMSPSTVRPAIAPRLASTVMRSLHKDPAQA
jgi:hypothetical protein